MNIPATAIAWVALAVSVIAGIFSFTASRGGGEEAVQQRVADLAARVEAVEPFDASTLEKSVADLTAKLESVQFDPAPLQAKIEDLEKKLAAVPEAEPFDPAPLQSRLEELGQKITAMAAAEPFDPAPLQARIEELGAKLAAIEGFDPAALQSKVAELGSKLAAVEGLDPAALQSKVTELGSKLAAVEGFDPAALQARIDDLASRIAALKPFDPTPLQKQLDALNAAIASRDGGSASAGNEQRLLGQVFFATDSSALSEEARARLDGWIRELSGKPHRLAILGFSDRVGNPQYNVALSIRRAAAVRSYLLRGGLEKGSLVVSAGGYGEEGAPVPTDDNVDEPQNRTVHVYVYE